MVELLAASGELERIRPSPRYRRFMTGTQIEELYRLERAKFLAPDDFDKSSDELNSLVVHTPLNRSRSGIWWVVDCSLGHEPAR